MVDLDLTSRLGNDDTDHVLGRVEAVRDARSTTRSASSGRLRKICQAAVGLPHRGLWCSRRLAVRAYAQATDLTLRDGTSVSARRIPSLTAGHRDQAGVRRGDWRHGRDPRGMAARNSTHRFEGPPQGLGLANPGAIARAFAETAEPEFLFMLHSCWCKATVLRCRDGPLPQWPSRKRSPVRRGEAAHGWHDPLTTGPKNHDRKR